MRVRHFAIVLSVLGVAACASPADDASSSTAATTVGAGTAVTGDAALRILAALNKAEAWATDIDQTLAVSDLDCTTTTNESRAPSDANSGIPVTKCTWKNGATPSVVADVPGTAAILHAAVAAADPSFFTARTESGMATKTIADLRCDVVGTASTCSLDTLSVGGDQAARIVHALTLFGTSDKGQWLFEKGDDGHLSAHVKRFGCREFVDDYPIHPGSGVSYASCIMDARCSAIDPDPANNCANVPDTAAGWTSEPGQAHLVGQQQALDAQRRAENLAATLRSAKVGATSDPNRISVAHLTCTSGSGKASCTF